MKSKFKLTSLLLWTIRLSADWQTVTLFGRVYWRTPLVSKVLSQKSLPGYLDTIPWIPPPTVSWFGQKFRLENRPIAVHL